MLYDLSYASRTAYNESGSYDSPNYKTDFLPYYATEKDLAEINKLLDWKYPSGDLIDALFMDKAHSTKFSILQLISQIRERQYIKRRNLEKINYGLDNFKSQFVQVEDLCLYNEMLNLDNRKTRINLTQKIAGLEKEKRAEETSCWHDLGQLRKELIDLIKEYKLSSRKKELMENARYN